MGLHLRSYRVEGGLEATLQLDKKYQAFPGAAGRPVCLLLDKKYQAVPGAAGRAGRLLLDKKHQACPGCGLEVPHPFW